MRKIRVSRWVYRPLIIILLLIFALFPSIAQNESTLQVSLADGDPNAISQCDGSRFSQIYANVSDAITCAISGDTIELGPDIFLSNLIIDRSLTFVGAGATNTMLIGDGTGSVIVIEPDVAVELDGVTIMGGNSDQGGGIFTVSGQLTINNSIITENTATVSGSGIFTYAGSVEINNSIITNNSLTETGGGIDTVAGTIRVNNSTISDNTVNQDGAGLNTTTATVYIENSTIANNAATGNGGGVATQAGAIYLNNVTVTENSAFSGGGVSNDVGLVTTQNSILASNIGVDCEGILQSGGYNIIQVTGVDCSLIGDLTGNQIGVDPLLGIFADYNEDSNLDPLSYELLTGSPAINAGNPASCTATDQRGLSRDFDTCDIGSYEGLRGDCNSDLANNAGDLSAVQIEIFDDDASTDPSINFSGNSMGCDANDDNIVDAGDVSCTTLIIFNGIDACQVTP